LTPSLIKIKIYERVGTGVAAGRGERMPSKMFSNCERRLWKYKTPGFVDVLAAAATEMNQSFCR